MILYKDGNHGNMLSVTGIDGMILYKDSNYGNVQYLVTGNEDLQYHWWDVTSSVKVLGEASCLTRFSIIRLFLLPSD